MWVNVTYKLVWLVWLASGVAAMQHSMFLPEKENATTYSSGLTRTLSETTVIKGVVLDEVTGQPIGYANVVQVQSKISTQTNGEGQFVLQLPVQYKAGSIKISSLSYAPKVVSVTEILQKGRNQEPVKIYLKPSYKSLRAVEVSAKSKKWKARKVGFNIDKGTRFHHQFNPLDTLVEKSGQEVGNRFQLKKYPAILQSISFGLAGSGNVKAIIGLRLYSLKNNLPDKDLLPERIILRIPPHHTGWITVDMGKYNINLKEDFAVAVEWLSETNQLTRSSLMAFAKHPKGQVTYYRASDQKPWTIQKSTLTNINSMGLYVTVLY